MENRMMIKTGDIQSDIYCGYYSWLQDQRWIHRKDPEKLASLPKDSWNDDFVAYLIYMGVPKVYAQKVANCAWERGHACGYAEVFNVSYDLIEIFKN